MIKDMRLTAVLVLAIFVAAVVVACKKQTSESTASTPAPAQTGAVSTGAEAKLAKADALDGSTDHVVAKCGMCALRMDGSEAYTSQVGDYELRFCSEGCKESFDENQEKAILALNVGD